MWLQSNRDVALSVTKTQWVLTFPFWAASVPLVKEEWCFLSYLPQVSSTKISNTSISKSTV